MLTSEQIRAARALLRWDQALLAKLSGVSLATIKRIEGRAGEVQANQPTIDAIVRALTSAEVVFQSGGVGYRLKRIGDRVFYRPGDIGVVVDVESEPLRLAGDGYPAIRVRFSHYQSEWIPQHQVQFEPVEGASVGEMPERQEELLSRFRKK
jgi:transcriptional regulator with XRE-family HTH domain